MKLAPFCPYKQSGLLSWGEEETPPKVTHTITLIKHQLCFGTRYKHNSINPRLETRFLEGTF